MLRVPAIAALLLCALVDMSAWAQSAPERQTKAFELTQQRKGSCIMPEMPAAITYNRMGANGQMIRTTAPCREDEGMCSMSLNTYANGSHMCIAGFRNQESCRTGDCKPGWRHRCTDGWWKRTETCLPGELKKAKFDLAREVGAAAGAAAGRSIAGQGKRGDPFAKQIEALKPELDAREKGAMSNGQCGKLSPDMSDLEQESAAAAVAGGIPASKLPRGGNMRQELEALIAQAGSLDELIRLARAQINANQEALRTSDTSSCSATRQHVAACELIRISTKMNQRWLDWLLCHKRARG